MKGITTNSIIDSEVIPEEGTPIQTEPAYRRKNTSSGLSNFPSRPMGRKHPTMPHAKKSMQIRPRCQSSLDRNPQYNSQIYKQRIVDQRKAANDQAKKQRSYSIDAGYFSCKNTQNNIMNRGQSRKMNITMLGLSKNDHNASFLTQCLNREEEFMDYCRKSKYQPAEQVLTTYLNYAVDFNNREVFFRILQSIAQFHAHCQNYRAAMRYYVQMREGAILQKMYAFLMISLVGISECCEQVNFFEEGIIFLKKALDYAWLVKDKEMELKIYDQMGKKYYREGDMNRAKKYHDKYSTGNGEPAQSPLRVLATQTIVEEQQKNLNHEYSSLNALFLVHMNLPLKNRSILVSCCPNPINIARDRLPDLLTKKSLSTGRTDDIDFQVKKLLRNWMFNYESEEPNLQVLEEPRVNQRKNRKAAYLDFKMNQHLRMKGIKPLPKNPQEQEQSSQRQSFARKESLDEKVKRMAHEPGLHDGWYQEIVHRVQSDQRRKMNHISDKIRLGKGLAHQQDKLQKFRHLYRVIIEKLTIDSRKGEKKLQQKSPEQKNSSQQLKQSG